MIPYKISFIGAGKLAGALCMELYNTGFHINKIISKNGKTASILAKMCKATWSTELVINDNTDIVIVAVPDHKLEQILQKLVCNDEIVVAHTAGSIGLEVFHDKFKHSGVIYPLMTFSEGRKVDFSQIPFFIEASDKYAGSVFESIANTISKSVSYTNSEKRRMIHLAAVFVSNFTNHMLTEGKEIAVKAGFPFDVLLPLINETIKKAGELGPENAQTGPAVRNDIITIEKHLELLSFSPELRNIYNEITNSIIKRYNKQ
jgi:predicted short-subunit dehydrogenase-like oxidoreductase (DUF2520 family)